MYGWVVAAVLFVMLVSHILYAKQIGMQRAQLRQALADRDAVHRVLNGLVAGVPGASRAITLVAKDHGEVPRPDVPLLVTALCESHDENLPSVVEQYQEYPTDRQYVSMLLRLHQKGRLRNETRTMPSGWLRDLYASQGVTHSDLYLLDDGRGFIHYLSINYTSPPSDAPECRTVVEQAAQSLRGLLRA